MDRKEISLRYSLNKNWIAGSYYIENIIQSLNTLPDEQKPSVNILCESQEEFDRICKLTKYSYLEYRFYNPFRSFFKRALNRLGFAKLDIGKSLFIFPCSSIYEISDANKNISWIPDFQEKYYPENFTAEELRAREERCVKFIRCGHKIIFSSNDAKNDFDKFYPQNRNKKFILHFAVTHPDFSQIEIETLKNKFDFQGDYYFCANQFWQHKNHKLLFRAIKILKEKGKNSVFLCSGSTKDYRNAEYFPMLEKFITESDLAKNIKILGFIDRAEQLCLMKNSIAIIQPSLFEGWSTVVEDCKALGKFVYVSDIPVHREQIGQNACFFNPKDEMDLVDKIQNIEPICEPIDYAENVKQFGRDFLAIMQKIENLKQFEPLIQGE